MPTSTNEKVAIGLGIGLSAVALTGAYYWYSQKVKNAYPKSWKKVGTISKLAFSPLKSCRMIYLEEADCKLVGIEKGQCRDHMFLLIDDDSKVATARKYPHMLKIEQTLTNNGLTVTAPDMEPLEIKFDYQIGDGETIQVEIGDETIFAVECGANYSKWFSKYIQKKDKGLRLLYYPYKTPTRHITKMFQNGIFLDDDTGSLQDVSSYMLMNEKSMQDLNARLKRPVDAFRFRPNFLVKTDGPAFDEDNWQWIRIGYDAEFRSVFPCLRCILPNIDLETTERDPDGDPLRTLKTYRTNPKWKSPMMGIQLGLRKAGHVKLGDDVYVGV